ncbi:MAG TPA: hypothetical protein VLW50_01495 [Streptosporangiaceae bacterium]|nr:hypothetical protein [Streptosporangiaceae bacterium]
MLPAVVVGLPGRCLTYGILRQPGQAELLITELASRLGLPARTAVKAQPADWDRLVASLPDPCVITVLLTGGGRRDITSREFDDGSARLPSASAMPHAAPPTAIHAPTSSSPHRWASHSSSAIGGTASFPPPSTRTWLP